jgi:hypothetical protein
VTNTRFERFEHTAVCKVFDRGAVNPRLDFNASMDSGAFLGRLWALFGPASPRDDGFSYDLRDRETGLAFSAYSGASGPSYGGPIDGGEALRPVLEAFERLLDATPPADCELTYSADQEYGGGKRVVGCRDGRGYDLTARGSTR